MECPECVTGRGQPRADRLVSRVYRAPGHTKQVAELECGHLVKIDPPTPPTVRKELRLKALDGVIKTHQRAVKGLQQEIKRLKKEREEVENASDSGATD